jgi:hypothetical protein
MYIEPTIQSPHQLLALDSKGNRLYVYDLVKVTKIPDFYFTEKIEEGDNLFEVYKSYVGCYGFLRYDEHLKSDNRIIWIDSEKALCVDVIKCDNDFINVYDFLLYSDCIERVEPNFLLYSIFSKFNFPIYRDQYKSLENKKGIMGFDLIEAIIKMPPEKLQEAQSKLLEFFPDLLG